MKLKNNMQIIIETKSGTFAGRTVILTNDGWVIVSDNDQVHGVCPGDKFRWDEIAEKFVCNEQDFLKY